MRDAKLETIELLKEFQKYVEDCILLHELDTESPPRPMSFDEWYVRIWKLALPLYLEIKHGMASENTYSRS